MKTGYQIRNILLVFILGCFSACSDGGGISGSDMVAGGGIGGTGVISTGEISAIGSVWVNGVEFDTRSAEVYVNDQYQATGDPGVLENLEPGLVVRVSGKLNAGGSGRADQVFYRSTLTGPITAIDVIDDYDTLLSILGQTVIIDDRTRRSGIAGDPLAVGNVVEVSGFFDDAGRIQATFITRTAAAAPADASFVISGPVSSLDESRQTFFIGSQAVDYAAAEVGELDPQGLSENLLVWISGRLAETVLQADVVRPGGRLEDGGSDAETVEMEGIAGQGLADDRFVLEGYPVEIDASTAFVGGTAEDILPGSRMEVEGAFGNGILEAEKIKFSRDFKAESDIAAVTPDGTLTLVGMEEVTISVNDLTRITGQARSFEDLAAGNHLKVKGWIAARQTVVAGQIVVLPPVSDKVSLRGTVSTVDEPTIFINGVAVDTDMIPSDGFFAEDDEPVSAETFFSRVETGDWVEAKGQLLPDGSAAWQTVALVRVF